MTSVLHIEGMALSAGEDPQASFRLTIPKMTLGKGDCVAVIGPSGCGKSTFLEVLALLRRPDHTRHFYLQNRSGSRPIDLDADGDFSYLRQGPIGYVPQMGGVLPFLTARSHIEATLHLAGLAKSEVALARLQVMAQTLDLSNHLRKRRAELSGGQRKRVALLAGLSVPRTLLIADEPTAGLDPQNAERVMQSLGFIAKGDGTAIVIATHDLGAAQRAGFKIMSISGGVLAQANQAEDVSA